MLSKLQRKTLIPAQIAGYIITLLIGVAIVLLTFQLYDDLKPLLTQQTDVFKAHTVTVSKNVTIFKTANKEGIYFNDDELKDIQEQKFVNKVAKFTSASFSTSASINLGSGGKMSTDLFFESVPDEYIDVVSDKWKWDSTSNFLPIIIPEDYLNLYNFGFAESQSLPVISQGSIEQISFNIHVWGNGKRRDFESRIVGFSNKINSILVPNDFLQWANQEFGKAEKQRNSRILVEFSDATDENIPAYFESNGLDINQNELESSKMAFFFKMAMLFVFAVAAIIILLSMAFIIMSLNLIVQKNKELFVNLYNIGYSPKQIARFYQIVVSAITVADILLSAILANCIRNIYVSRLSSVFKTAGGSGTVWITAAVLCLILLVVYNILIRRTISRTVAE